ncbi:inactive Rho GTPase-activating protein 11B-like [Nerophis lumbriciformis]|uniref:inactive Rho GTPase-activating protein 11B-like n=1 Tax=Nerophis lumbriciformis TaxID=546530 RepID=UPI002ADF6D2A|nr:inactive Rho GTPase-activating protein 11B-like [Nerophis lumbriciformis]
MKVTDNNVIRFHLQVIHGINVRSVERKNNRLFLGGAKVFGVPLENLPRCFISEFGLVPCFLVDACSLLLERAGTVGLFRKPGSLPRIKSLRAKLNRGEACLSTALPYDVATLVKQFCRELPEPLFPPEIQDAMLKAQTLAPLQDRTSALQLLSCLLPARNSSCLHYLFDFLSKVSHRCEENLMTASNLAMVFAPCLLPPPNKDEMSEGRFELRILVLRAFVENPQSFGVIPKVVMDSMEFLMNFHLVKETSSKRGTRKRHSLKVKTVPWIQGRSKVRLPVSQQKLEPTLQEKPTLRRSLGQETFPNVLLFRTCLPSAEHNFSSAASTSERMKRLVRGPDVSFTPSVLAGMGKLQLAAWNRRSSL